jgi:hypothetical protein
LRGPVRGTNREQKRGEEERQGELRVLGNQHGSHPFVNKFVGGLIYRGRQNGRKSLIPSERELKSI